MKSLLTLMLLVSYSMMHAQHMKWPEGKKSLIVLTYDDALESQLKNAIPQLDKANLKGTFFLKEPATEAHVSQWMEVHQKGHELGNHTIYHPCHSSRFAADSRYHSENYSINHIMREIKSMNILLSALDKRTRHTYAFPCAETTVGGESYLDTLRKSGYVKYARSGGAFPIVTDFKKLDPFDVPCMGYNSPPSGKELIEFVKKVQESKGMAVFIFHGVGGDYLEVSSEAHQELVNYLKNNKDIWVTTFEEAMDYVVKNGK